MKIAIITNSHRIDDTRLFWKIASTLAGTNEVTIFGFKGEVVENTNVRFVKKQELDTFDNLIELYRCTKKYNPDLLICVEPLTLVVGNILKKKLHLKLVYDCHEFFGDAFAERFKDPLSLIMKRFYLSVENYMCRKVDSIWVVNSLLRNRFRKKGNVEIISNYPISVNDTITSDYKYDVIYAGGVTVERGVFKLIKATSIIKKSLPEIKVLILGRVKNELIIELQEKILALNLVDNVKLLSEVSADKAQEYISNSKVGISLLDPNVKRYKKALPLKTLEYLSHGLQVITNDFDFQKTFLKELGDSVQFIEYNSLTLAKAIGSAVSKSPIDLDEISKQNKAFVNGKAHWSGEAKKLNTFINSISLEKELLFCTYFYPPLGGPAVQRPCKTIKYLTKLGWKCDVLTVDKVFYHSEDKTLLTECMERNLFRTPSLDPMSVTKAIKTEAPTKNSFYFNAPEKMKVFIKKFFPIDDKIGWLLPAVIKGVKEARKNNYKYVISTMGPYTTGLIGYYISKICNIPLVIDYRDHWTINPYDDNLKILRPLSVYWEKKLLNHSYLVTVIGKVMKEQLCQRFGEDLSEKIEVLYNGFDESDFTNYVPSESSETVVLSYLGNFYRNRTPKYFLKAINELKAEGYDFSRIKVNFVGNYYREAMELLKDKSLSDIVEVIPQVTHDKVIQHFETTSALILFIANENGKGVLTGKLFEYLRSGLPILAMVPPDGEAAEILKENYQEFICKIDDVPMIKETLKQLIDSIHTKRRNLIPTNKYSRETQINELNKRLV